MAFRYMIRRTLIEDTIVQFFEEDIVAFNTINIYINIFTIQSDSQATNYKWKRREDDYFLSIKFATLLNVVNDCMILGCDYYLQKTYLMEVRVYYHQKIQCSTPLFVFVLSFTPKFVRIFYASFKLIIILKTKSFFI